MPFTLGAYTACLQDRTLEDALEILKANGLSGAEINVGGFIPSPHAHVELLLTNAKARADYLDVFARHEMTLSGLNTSGNPLSPHPGQGPKHANDLRQAIELATNLGVREIVAMSGCPGSDPDAKYPSWVVNPWDGVYLDVLDYQWDVLIRFWKEIDQFAENRGVDICWELHPHNVVFNVPTFERFIAEAATSNIKVNMDPSHLFWQQMEPIEAVHRLGSHIGHVHAKDTRILPGASYRGVLDTSFARVPADAAGKVPTGIGTWCNAWPQDPAWRFVAVGLGHDVEYWTQFLASLAEINPDLNINIEHEDASFGQEEGLAVSATNLLAAVAHLSANAS